jgi:hypothetical protein
MKSIVAGLALALYAMPAFAQIEKVPEPDGLGLVAGALMALVAVKVMRRR